MFKKFVTEAAAGGTCVKGLRINAMADAKKS
jgi:hypothetical protein